jgi:hypothetical protein
MDMDIMASRLHWLHTHSRHQQSVDCSVTGASFAVLIWKAITRQPAALAAALHMNSMSTTVHCFCTSAALLQDYETVQKMITGQPAALAAALHT